MRAALGEEGEATVSGQGSGESRRAVMGSSGWGRSSAQHPGLPCGMEWFFEVLMGIWWPSAWPGETVLVGPGGGHPASRPAQSDPVPVLRGHHLPGALGWQPQPLF